MKIASARMETKMTEAVSARAAKFEVAGSLSSLSDLVFADLATLRLLSHSDCRRCNEQNRAPPGSPRHYRREPPPLGLPQLPHLFLGRSLPRFDPQLVVRLAVVREDRDVVRPAAD